TTLLEYNILFLKRLSDYRYALPHFLKPGYTIDNPIPEFAPDTPCNRLQCNDLLKYQQPLQFFGRCISSLPDGRSKLLFYIRFFLPIKTKFLLPLHNPETLHLPLAYRFS